ncbi:hypothetical protein AGLY_013986 [Aphis glycines]|uniref:Transmembrane protein n=1 Tax=Aphis glycines TaxID=307491 RepID=A0A6G0T4S3_APHGL|nr:hypothetical protein AGLY_013986 [Aphis glycines]
MYSYNFLITIRITYQELCIQFSKQFIRNLVLNFQVFLVIQNFFTDTSKKKFAQKSKISVFLNYNHIKNRFSRKLVLRKNSRFTVIFLLFFSIFLKTVGKCLLFTSIMHKRYSLFHRKPPPKFEIEALFRLVILYTDTKKKTHIILVTIFFLSVYSTIFYEICQNRENLQLILKLKNHKICCRNDNDLKYLLLLKKLKFVDKIFLAQSKYLKILYKAPHMLFL